MKISKLIHNYKQAGTAIVKAFCKKQERHIDISDDLYWYEIDCFYMLHISDILLDIETEQPKGFIFEWYNSKVHIESNVNYQSYIMGLRN